MKITELLGQIKPYVLGWIRDYAAVGQVTASNVPRFVSLQSPLTSTSWDGDSFSDTAKTIIDMSSVFAVPSGVHALLVTILVRDSGSAANDTWFILSPTDVASEGIVVSPMPVDDRWFRCSAVVPCNADGDVYYQVNASGAGTMDVYLQVWGYWL